MHSEQGPPRWEVPLVAAASRGDLAVVNELLDAGVLVDQGESGWTPLHRALHGGHAEVALRLLDAGADPRQTNPGHYTPLYRASLRGMTSVASALLERGADVDAQEMEDGKTALIVAALRSLPALASTLLTHHADPTRFTHQGVTALEAAQRAARQRRGGPKARAAQDTLEVLVESVRERLRQVLASHDAVPAANLSAALRLAASTNEVESLKRLLALGASPDKSGFWNTAALGLAAMQGHAEASALLLEAGANAGRTTTRQLHFERLRLHTPLGWAIARDHGAVIAAMASAGVRLELPDARGFTPLMRAAQSGSLEALRALLDAGVDREARNRRGQRAFEVAEEARQGAAASILLGE